MWSMLNWNVVAVESDISWDEFSSFFSCIKKERKREDGGISE